MSNTYCPLAWIGKNILPNSIQPCCHWYGEGDSVDSKEELGYSPVFLDAREKMLKGEKVKGCTQCYLTEESGAESRRQQVIKQYGIVHTVENRILDISFDNLCNLKCRGCTSGTSHLWRSDEQEIYGQTVFDIKYTDNNLNINTSNLEYVGVSGGEPFLSKKFDSFAENILKGGIEKNIYLTINTNGTQKPSSIVYELLLNCKTLDIQVSIDGIGDLNSYFRSGSNFNECLDNLNFFKKLKDLRKGKETFLRIHTTVNIYNVNLLKDIEIYFTEHYPEYILTHRNLYWPAQLSIRHLPQEYKQILIPIVEKFGDKYKDVLYELTTNNENHFSHFLNFHNTLDSLRNEALNDNKLLSEFINLYPNTNKNSKLFFIKQLENLKCGT
jgi:pyruvate-formate lyase-activating enzyme